MGHGQGSRQHPELAGAYNSMSNLRKSADKALTPIPVRRRVLQGVCALALGGAGAFAFAADTGDYPTRAIHLFVPFPAGGAVDILGRLLGQHVSEQLGQSVIIENRPGANGNLAMEALVKMPADGYSLMIAGNGLATNGILYPKSKYNMPQDFSAVAYVGYAPLLMVVPADSPFSSLQEVLAAAKAKPGVVTYASAGSGSSAHLGAELLKYTAKVDFTHIPYKGGAPAIVDLVGNRVSFMLLDPAQAMPQLQTKRLRAIAVGSAERITLLPEVPTMASAGFPTLETTVWWGVVGPANIPAPIITKLNAAFNSALRDPTVQQRLTELGVTPQPETANQFDAFLRREIGKWTTVIRSAGIVGD